jgi:hypothetical protein
MYNELCLMKKNLEETLLEPSSATILNILSYARATAAKK